MRNLKKFLALVLAMIMIVGSTAMVSADFTDVAADSKYAAAINDLAVKGIIKGTSDTTFGPAQAVTRKQMAIFVARAMTGEVESDEVWAAGYVPFTDVVDYKGAIQHAWLNGVINGKSESIFAPEDGIKYIEGLKMAVCALGYGTDAEGNALAWPYGYFKKAVELELTDNLNFEDLEKALTREETAQLIYNMIYAAPADGSECFASANFDAEIEGNSGLYVISATPKQYHSVNQNDTSTGIGDKGVVYVGVQALVGGVPTGEIYYIPAADLGIADADVENYFYYSVTLINFDETTGEFGRAVLGTAPKTVLNTEVGNDYSKLTILGNKYVPMNNATVNSALINELVIYNGTDIANNTTELVTLAGDNGYTYVLDVYGKVVAYRLTTGSTNYKLYVEIATGDVLNEGEALAKYGYTTQHGAMNAADLASKAYSLSLFDDNGDNIYDRAIYNPVFMGVYSTYKLSNGTVCDGLIKSLYDNLTVHGHAAQGSIAANNAAANVTYTNPAAQVKGAVSVYSYNPQTMTVTVHDVLTAKTGNIKKVNYANGVFSMTVDSTVYKLYWFDHYDNADGLNDTNSVCDYWTNGTDKKGIAPSDLGAFVAEKAPASPSYGTADVAAKAFFTTFNTIGEITTKFYSTTTVGQDIVFYAYGEYILMADFVQHEFRDKFTVIEEPREFYYEGLYMDIFNGTEAVELAHIVSLAGVDISGFKTYDWLFADFLNRRELHYPGTIYAETYKYDGSYMLDKRLAEYDDYINAGLIDISVADDNSDGIIEFANGLSVATNAATRIYTDANTIWYFVEPENVAEPNPANTVVTKYVGAPLDNFIEIDADTMIFADKLGRYNGKATIIFVIDPADHDFASVIDGDSLIYTSTSPRIITAAPAADLGLEGYSGIYYMYNESFFNLDSGEIHTTIYSKYKLGTSSVYVVDENLVVKELAADDDVLRHNAAYGSADTFDNTYVGASKLLNKISTSYDVSEYNICDVDKYAGVDYRDFEIYAGEDAPDNDYAWSYNSTTGLLDRGALVGNVTDVPADVYDLPLTDELVVVAMIGGNYYVDFTDGDAYDVIAEDLVVFTVGNDYNGVRRYTGDDAIKALESSTEIYRFNDTSLNSDGTAVFFVNNKTASIFA